MLLIDIKYQSPIVGWRVWVSDSKIAGYSFQDSVYKNNTHIDSLTHSINNL